MDCPDYITVEFEGFAQAELWGKGVYFAHL